MFFYLWEIICLCVFMFIKCSTNFLILYFDKKNQSLFLPAHRKSILSVEFTLFHEENFFNTGDLNEPVFKINTEESPLFSPSCSAKGKKSLILLGTIYEIPSPEDLFPAKIICLSSSPVAQLQETEEL